MPGPGAGLTRRSVLAGAGAGLLAAGTHAAGASATAPGDDLVGTLDFRIAREKDTLLDIARASDLGLLELMAANPGIDPWIPVAGTPLIVPTAHVLPDVPRRGLAINLGELRLYRFGADGRALATHAIGIGREGFTTPLGSTTVVRKQADPVWTPTEATRLDRPDLPASIPPGPDNPMGEFAIYLGWPTYAIHGTNRPWGVGRLVSRGCIRLYPESIARLFGEVDVGTPVSVVDQPVKTGWRDGALYLEVHPSRRQLEELNAAGRMSEDPIDAVPAVAGKADAAAERVDWAAVRRAGRERTGVPVCVTLAARPVR